VRRPSFSLFKPVVAASGVAVVALAVLVPAQASASLHTSDIAKKHATINTFKAYDQAVGSLGCPNSTTYGETITVPAKKSSMTKFMYYMGGQAAAGQSMVVRGELYAWDGSKATGSAIFQTKKRTIAYADSLLHWETFKTRGAALTPGQQYVLFVSIDKDYEDCTGDYGLTWGAADGSAYAGGQFVFQNNSGDESKWTTTNWNPIPQLDAVMKVYLG
jgi:hypothetical protein